MSRLFSLPRPTSRARNNYPNRPIQLVVTVPPGGAADFVARLIGAKLSDALGQTVVISNRAGAGGTTAAAQVAKSDPDGYTLLLNTIATHGIGPHIYANLPYDPVKDFSPVILIAKLPLIMAVNAEVPARSVNDVIALAKAKPNELSFCSAGSGGAPHLAGELFKSLTGTELLHVPYRGSGPAVIDLIAGRITMMFDATPSLLPNIMAGKLRPLARRKPATPSALAGRPLLRGARLSRNGHRALVWRGGARRHAGADRATAQCRPGQNSGNARRPQKPDRSGRRRAGRHRRRLRRVHAQRVRALERGGEAGRDQAGMTLPFCRPKGRSCQGQSMTLQGAWGLAPQWR